MNINIYNHFISNDSIQSFLEYFTISGRKNINVRLNQSNKTADYYVIFGNPEEYKSFYFEPSTTILILLEMEDNLILKKHFENKYFQIFFIKDWSQTHLATIQSELISRLLKHIEMNRWGIEVEKIYIINLEHRKDRRNKMENQLIQQNFNMQKVEFFNAIKHDNGTIGCMLSHLEIIKSAKEQGLKNVMILEDDCVFLSYFKFSRPPKDWQMIFFGGAVNKIIDDYNHEWKRVSTWYAHCYIINADIFDNILFEANKWMGTKAIDEVYCEHINMEHPSYIHYPTLATQTEDYSDIEKRDIDRNQKVLNFDQFYTSKTNNPALFPFIYCINLKIRPDKKQKVLEQFDKYNLNVKFFEADLHQNPARGCLESHVEVLIDAKERGLKNVLIFEDDIEILDKFLEIKWDTVPSDWEMLYLGGNHYEILEHTSNDWKKIRSWSTYAYAVNSSLYDIIIQEAVNNTKEIDKFYLENIHPNYNCYMSNPKVVIPCDGENFSDIMGQKMDYSFLRSKIYLTDKSVQDNVEEINKTNTILKDEDLPNITIVTPTLSDRKHMFKLPLMNFSRFDYPREKIEWIILAEGPTSFKDIIPYDERIRYIHLSNDQVNKFYGDYIDKIRDDIKSRPKKRDEKQITKKILTMIPKIHHYGFYKGRLPIGMKRNILAQMAKNEIIVHMDDDDYYPPESLKYRVMQLMNNGKNCLFCTTIPSFNIKTMVSMINVPPFDLPFEKRVSEATMIYKKSFWREKKYDNLCIGSEAEEFLRSRKEETGELDWKRTIVSLLHSKNISSRTDKQDEPNGWHFGKISDELFLFLTSLDENKNKNIRLS
jgi:GR25 family glycosyltransferase involved in LPS biosynthesis